MIVKGQYSASDDDLEMVGCFFDFQDTIEEPKKMEKSVIDFLVSGQAARSKSLESRSLKSLAEEKKKKKTFPWTSFDEFQNASSCIHM